MRGVILLYERHLLTAYSPVGVTAQYPEGRDFLIRSTHAGGPYNTTGLLAALHMGLSDEIVTFAGHDINDYFVQGAGFLHTPEMSRILGNDAVQGFHGIPQMPVFVYKAIADEMSDVEDTDALVERFCEVGANILYQRNTVGHHNDEIANGAPRAIEWLVEVLEGSTEPKQPAAGCLVENVTVNVTASTA